MYKKTVFPEPEAKNWDERGRARRRERERQREEGEGSY